MTHTHDVISAFLDDEAFDATELADALSTPDGRNALIELVAVRHLVQPDANAARALERRPAQSIVRRLVAVAAVLVALVAGYAIGERRVDVDALDPPAPTRVVQAATGWQEVPAGSLP
jgi:hypothetical protein